MKRSGFTMIELVFVIVILGILAAVAVPKLTATRDDAKVSTELSNLTTCINDAGNAYTATGTEDNTSSACTALKCFTVTTKDKNGTDSATDGLITVYKSGSDAYCTAAKTTAETNKLSAGTDLNTGLEHKFGGTGISY